MLIYLCGGIRPGVPDNFPNEHYALLNLKQMDEKRKKP